MFKSLRHMFGWTDPKASYGDALGLSHVAASQQGIQNASTATSLASLPYPNGAQNAAHNPYGGYQNIASSATQARQAAVAQQQLNAYKHAQAKIEEPPKINLNEGAWSIPLSQLVDLWIVRFGSKWVDHEEVASDEFYQIACMRLERMGKLETHHLQDRYMPVYKIVE